MPDSASEDRRAYALVAAATLTYTGLMFVWFSLPAYLTTVVDDVGLTNTQAGLLVGAVPATYVPIGLVSGALVDRIGPGRSLAAGTLIYGLAQVARSFAGGFPGLLAATLALGVGATAITFGLPKLVSVCFPPDRTGPPSSIYLIGASAGSAAAFGVGRPVLGPLLGGWRALFLWSGAAAVGYALVWYLLARRAGLAAPADDASPLTLASVGSDIRAVLGNRELQLVVVVGAMYLMATHGLQGWLPTVLEARGVSPDRAGQTTSLFVVAVAVGVFAVPALADRYDARRAAVAACGAVFAAGGSGLVLADTGFPVYAAVVVAGAGVGGLSPLIRAIPPDLEGVGSRLTGTAVGFVFAVGEIGGFLGPVIVGSLREATGSYAPGLAVLAGGGLVVVAAGTALTRAARA